MKTKQRIPVPWRAAAAFGLAALMFAGRAGAGVKDSRHDFGSASYLNLAVATNGVCSSCHITHKAQVDLPGPPLIRARLWPRSLAQENTCYLLAADPNYKPGATLLCYDCHDDATTGAGHADADPDPTKWLIGTHKPQDIARGVLDGGPVGYYELSDGTFPTTAPVPIPATTGGHFWETAPTTGTPLYERGDKIHCGLCHDPHNNATGTNDVFFLTNSTNGSGTSVPLGNGLKASVNVRNHQSGGTGREMCAACHGYSNAASTKIFWGVNLGDASHLPSATISQHNSSNATPCTNCHKHNKISFSCRECHGFPPLNPVVGGNYFDKALRPDTENYTNGAGTHRRHKDALGDLIFACDICHGPNPGPASGWHDQDAVNPGIVEQSQVNIMGKTSFWAPVGYPGGLPTPAYTNNGGGPPSTPSGWSFSQVGGGVQRCSGVACHGNPLSGDAVQLNWTDDMVDEGTGNPTVDGLTFCKWCHDATPATINGGTTYAPNVKGNTAATFGADVNGHGRLNTIRYDKDTLNDAAGALGAGKECTVCHDATYTTVPPTHPTRTHFGAGTDPRDNKRLRDTINSGSPNITNSPTFPTGPDQACSACHQNGVNTATDGFDQPYHGIPPQPPPAGGYVPSEGAADPPFTRACRQCHEVHGSNWNGTGRNLYMVGKWIDVNGDRVPNVGDGAYVDSNATTSLTAITSGGGPGNDNPVVFTATSGADSFDENDGVYNAVDDTDDVCATCHSSNTRGGNHSGTASFSADMRGQNCLQCHDHDYDNAYATIDAFMPSGCEGCHGNPPSKGCDNNQNTADDAPNVMGDGTVAGGTGGTKKAYDDGYYGYNVNGHGANGTAIYSPTPALTPNLACTACHDLSSPSPSTHFDCNLSLNLLVNTRNYFGKAADTRNANTSHLVSGFLAGADNPSAKQVGFDNFCYGGVGGASCHAAAPRKNMRHSFIKIAGGGFDPDPSGIVEFNTANTVTGNPKQDLWSAYPGGNAAWTPWTISDLTNVAGVNANPPTVLHNGVCVSCHNPHGTSTLQKGGTQFTNMMVIRNWQDTEMNTYCQTCHRLP